MQELGPTQWGKRRWVGVCVDPNAKVRREFAGVRYGVHFRRKAFRWPEFRDPKCLPRLSKSTHLLRSVAVFTLGRGVECDRSDRLGATTRGHVRAGRVPFGVSTMRSANVP